MNVVKMLIVSALLCALIPGVTRAGGPAERETLWGLKGVAVVVEPPVRETEARKLPEATLRADVEKVLKRNAIPVLTAKQRESAPGSPCLCATVSADTVAGGSLVYSIELALKQEARLTRNGMVVRTATTWSTTTVGMSDDPGSVRNELSSMVDIFCGDYTASNVSYGK